MDLGGSVNFVAELAQEAHSKIDSNHDKISKLSEKLTQTESEMAAIKLENQQLKSKIISLETYSRRDNLLFFGVDERRNETDRDCATQVFKILEKNWPGIHKNIQILKCHRKGKYVNGQKRPIIAKFSINDRDNICSKKGNLKGSNLFIAEDFPLEIEQNRRILLPVFRHARTIESFKGKVSLKADKLVIDGRTYTVDTLNKLPPSLNPFTYSARQNETVLVFHGTSSPLANSYPRAFKEKDITFNNVEQYMYYHKALTAGDDIAATRMPGIKHVTEQRRLNKSVNTVPQWAGLQREKMKTGNRLKFGQNEVLAGLLNSLRPRQNGRHFADDISKCIFLNENVWIPIKISLKFVPKGPINDIPALVQIMAWRRPGDKPLSEPMLVSLPTHICVTRPQWVKGTGNLILGEANHYDKMYGTGIRLTDPQALDDKSWPGDNILGEILMTIRGQLE